MTLILDYDIISKETKTNNRAVGGDMLLRQIKYFCTIVEEGSFTEAAEKCFISQSAISQQIQSLEKELGVKLIKRENRRFSLTHAGMNANKNMSNVIKQAQKMQAEMEKVQEELEDKVVEGTAGGGAVTATANGKKEILSLKISPDAVDPEDIETLEDLVMVAVNDAVKKADDMMAEGMSAVTGGINIPGLF